MSDWALRATRWGQFAAVLILFGSALWGLYAPQSPVLDDDPLGQGSRRLRSNLLTAALVGGAMTMGWLLAEASAIAGSALAVGAVLSATHFGRAAGLRILLLAASAASALLMRPGVRLWATVSVLGAAASASFAWTGHGTVGTGSAARLHLAADVLHLLAAGVWIGALPPLSRAVVGALRAGSELAAVELVQTLRRFSLIGPSVVPLLVLTGLVNSWFLIGLPHWRALFGSAYALTLAIKIALFGLMLVLAATHRYRATPALQASLVRAADPVPLLQRLRGTMLAELLLALLVLAAVAVLGTLEPPVAAP